MKASMTMAPWFRAFAARALTILLVGCPREHVTHDGRPIAGQEPQHHRATSDGCSRREPPTGRFDPHDQGCHSDDECAQPDAKLARCVDRGPRGNAPPINECFTNICYVDADCPGSARKTALCLCGGHGEEGSLGNRCVPGNCRTDADCGSGGFCSPTYGTSSAFCTEPAGFFCRTRSDECLDNADCPYDQRCNYDEGAERWKCKKLNCPRT
jgi:Cys-rich repeat protein